MVWRFPIFYRFSDFSRAWCPSGRNTGNAIPDGVRPVVQRNPPNRSRTASATGRLQNRTMMATYTRTWAPLDGKQLRFIYIAYWCMFILVYGSMPRSRRHATDTCRMMASQFDSSPKRFCFAWAMYAEERLLVGWMVFCCHLYSILCVWRGFTDEFLTTASHLRVTVNQSLLRKWIHSRITLITTCQDFHRHVTHSNSCVDCYCDIY